MDSRPAGRQAAARKRPRRRAFLKQAGITAATAAALAGAGFPRPAIAQGALKWRVAMTWPKNFPGLSTGATTLADFIARASGGRLTVEVFSAGEVVPGFEILDAVSRGDLEMGHGAPYYWTKQQPAMQFLASLPFGLTAMEQNAWLQAGGGQELAEKAYRELGCKFFASGNTGMQAGGWFTREVRTMEDFKSLKMRIPRLGGEVVKAAGGTVLDLRAGEIPPALHSGAIDAAEWFGPYNDLSFGLHKSAKLYYYPGWHEPATLLDNFINMAAWESLDSELQAIVAAANAVTNQYVLNEFTARNAAALRRLRTEHGVILKKFPDPVLNGLGGLSGEVIRDLAAADPLSGEVLDSILDFRAKALGQARIAEQAFYNARTLPFRFVR